MAGLCQDRVCVVTGGGRGIGREYALMLAAEGAAVVVNDLGSAPDGSGVDHGPANEVVDQIVAAGGAAVANGNDVSSWEGARELVHTAIDTFGKLDVLVNNAGILRDRMLTNMTEQEWDSVIAVHLKGTFCTMRWAAEYWRERSKAGDSVDARVINTTSNSGIYGNVGQTNYGAAKAGIASLTFIAALELRRYGVTVNAISPGARTRLTEPLARNAASDGESAGSSPRWIAPLCTWLASPLSADVTGRVFEATSSKLAVAEGWHRGPTADPVDDPKAVDPLIRELLSRARPPATMDGSDWADW
jgi:NAD(P)-dependent dehydrogenase (short-subunit alcohol dehydrogenase family)